MEARNLFVLSGTEQFMKGELNNVTLADGSIVLDSTAGRHVLYGCYTSPAIPLPSFDTLIMSWNASTPRGTVVEAQARVLIDGNWSGWNSFGKWSPFMRRACGSQAPRGPVSLPREFLLLDSKTALQAQLRIYLYTESDKLTPAVHLLAVSVHGAALPPLRGKPVYRALRIPAYSQHLRDPAFGPDICLPLSLAGLMNRWGEDVLPEELAHAMYDWADHSCGNLAFAAAVAGCWGYPCYAAFMELAHLRDEIRSGSGVAVCMHTPERPGHHILVVTGFAPAADGAEEQVLVNDPAQPTDRQAETRLPLSEFLRQWAGLGLILEHRVSAHSWDKPARTAVTLLRDEDAVFPPYFPHDSTPALPQTPAESSTPLPQQAAPESAPPPALCQCTLCVSGEPITLPEDFCGSREAPTGTLAFSVSDGVVHATTAHKAFRFISVSRGGVQLPIHPGRRRVTVYAIDFTGAMQVGDISL